jgi:hypothetical protein
MHRQMPHWTRCGFSPRPPPRPGTPPQTHHRRGRLLGKALYSFMSRHQRHSILWLHPQHPLWSLPLGLGGPVLHILDANYNTVSHRSSLQSRCFRIKHHCDIGGFCSRGCLPCPGQTGKRHKCVHAPSGQMLHKRTGGSEETQREPGAHMAVFLFFLSN